MGADGATKARRDFVIFEIDVRAARRANRRARSRTNFLLRLAIETLDHRTALPAPESFKFLQERWISLRSRLAFKA